MDRDSDTQQYLRAAMSVARDSAQRNIKFCRAIQLWPENYYLSYKYAMYLSSIKNYVKSGHMFAKAAILNPQETDTYLQWGNSAFLAGKYDEAAEIYQKLLSIKPEMGLAHNNYGFILYSQEKFDEALARFLKAAKLDTIGGIAHFNASLVLFHQGKEKKGIKRFKKGIKAIGIYSIQALIENYDVQITHTEEKLKEELSHEQRLFLNAKLKGITQVVDLLKHEKKVRDVLRDLKDLGNFDLDTPILTKYYDFLVYQLTKFLEKTFIFKDGVYSGCDDNLLEKLVSKWKKTFFKYTGNEEPENIKLYPKFLIPCTTKNQFNERMQAIAKSITMLKTKDMVLINNTLDELDQDKLVLIKEIQELLEARNIEEKIEERAFLDFMGIIGFLTISGLALERENLDIIQEIYIFMSLYFEKPESRIIL